MTKKPKTTPIPIPDPGGEKTPHTYRLSAQKIAKVREVLNAPTATAAIETALDMVLFRKELVDGTAAMLGVKIDAPFER